MTDEWTPRDDVSLACDVALVEIGKLIEACEVAARSGKEPTPEIVAELERLFEIIDRFEAEARAVGLLRHHRDSRQGRNGA